MLTLAQLAESLDGVLHGNANHVIFGLSSLSRATVKDMACFDNGSLRPLLDSSLAGAVLLKSEHLKWCATNAIIVSDPKAAMSHAMTLLSGAKHVIAEMHSTAQIHPTARLGTNISVGPYSVIGENVCIDDGVFIGANTVIEPTVKIGKHTNIAANVVVHEGVQIGQDAVINSGCIIGALPFNYLKQHGVWQEGPALGGVVLADDVHIGANTVIDRGSLSDTYIAQGVCIDNLVQIAHDVIVGANTAIAGCAAIGAYAQIGSDCIIGGASCIAAHVRLTDDVVISGMSTVSKSIHKAGIYSSGTLVHEHQRWRRNAARFRRLDDYILKLGELEKLVNQNSV